MNIVKVEHTPSLPTAVEAKSILSSAIEKVFAPPGTDSDNSDTNPDIVTPSPRKRGRPRKAEADDNTLTPQSKKAKKAKGCKVDGTARKAMDYWRSDEDAILVELIKGLAKEALWNRVKEDGRLVGRGNSGVRARANTLLSRFEK